MAKLELFVSPPGTGKTTHCIDLFRAEVSKSGGGIDSRSYFILPSREHAERIQNLVLKAQLPGLFNAHILSMNDLAPRLLPGSGAMHPTDTIRRAVIRRILEGSVPGNPEFPYFKQVREFGGFQDLLVEAVKEFYSNLLDVEEFESLAQPLLKEAVFRSKFRDFSMILKNYAMELARLGLEEPQTDIRRLKESQGVPGQAPGDTELVIFDGFYHFTHAQKSLIQLVSGHARHVVVTLTLPDRPLTGSVLFEYPERTMDFLIKSGFSVKKDLFKKPYRVQDEALLHLEKNIFRVEADVFSGVPLSITRLEAPSVRLEVEMIARQIRELYRGSSCHFSDICLILRSVDRYENVIRSVFDEYEIPVFIHERYQLIQNGPVRALYRLLKLILDGWKREDLLHLAKSSFFPNRPKLQDVLALETATFRENITAGRAVWEEAVKENISAKTLKPFIDFLSGCQDNFLAAENVRQFGARIDELTGFLSLADASDENVNSQDTQAFACVKAILQSWRRYYEGSVDRVFDPRRFIQELSESIERGLFSLKPQGKNRVQVYDTVMALPKEFEVVFIAGLLEKSFPKSVTEDALFKDRQRKAINKNQTFLEERNWRVAGERYFFYMAVTRARRKLFLSYPVYNDQSRPTLPSFFLNEVERCFAPQSIRVVKKNLDDFLPKASEWATESEVLRGLSEILFFGGDFPAPLWNARLGDPALRRVVDHGLSPDEALILDPAVRGEFLKIENIFSATRLETYQNCAFRYFASKVLHLNEPLEGREAMWMGTLLHNTLEQFYKSLTQQEKKDGLYLKEGAKMTDDLWQCLQEQMAQGPFQNEPLYRQNVYKNQMRQALSGFVRHEQALDASRGLFPAHFEIGFGKKVNGELAYLEIAGEKKPIFIDGKIDRIDTTADGKKALVIDYKRSPRNLSAKIEKGLELQLPIYVLAAQRLLGLRVMGAEHRILTRPKKEGLYLEEFAEALGASKSQTRSPDEYRRFLDETEARIRGVVKRLHDADISVKSKSCDYCEFDPVCRFEKWKLVYENEKNKIKN